jgi:histidyl-tRNA synthetase
MQKLRNEGIRCEIYPDASKLDKQFKYADKKSIPFAIIIGSEEIQQGICKIKRLGTGEQQTVELTQLSASLFR